MSLSSFNQEDGEASNPDRLERLEVLESQSSENFASLMYKNRAIQALASFVKHKSKDHKRRFFERWKFATVAEKSSV
jgi:hypothetical protein